MSRYAPGGSDHFLLTQIMIDVNLRFDPDRRVFVQFLADYDGGIGDGTPIFIPVNPSYSIVGIKLSQSVSGVMQLCVHRF